MINWKPFSPKQLDFIKNSDAKMNIATGAVRSGKTIACTVAWINFLLQAPDVDYAMLGKSLGTLKRNVLNVTDCQIQSQARSESRFYQLITAAD